MMIYQSPIVSNKRVAYEFQGETITVHYQDQQDLFNLSFIGEGYFELFNDDGSRKFPTSLPFNPIQSVERNDGVLWVKVLYFISQNATEEERFPDWFEAS